MVTEDFWKLTHAQREEITNEINRRNFGYIAQSTAWGRWEFASCVERHGGHPWEASGTDDSYVDVSCGYCGADVEEMGLESYLYLEGEIDGIEIIEGQQFHPEPWGPVAISLRWDVRTASPHPNAIYPEVISAALVVSPR